MHVLLDLRGNIPDFIVITDGKTHDVNILDVMYYLPGAFYIFDRGYVVNAFSVYTRAARFSSPAPSVVYGSGLSIRIP